MCFTEFQATLLGLFTNLPKGCGNSCERVLTNTSSLFHCSGCSCHHWSDGNIKCISTIRLQGHLQTGYYEQLCSLSHNTAKEPQAYALQENHSECRVSKKIMLMHLICLKVAIFNNADPSWLLNVAVFSVKNIKWLWIVLSLV